MLEINPEYCYVLNRADIKVPDEKVTKLFNALDQDKNGYITVEVLTNWIVNLGISPKWNEIEAYIESVCDIS